MARKKSALYRSEEDIKKVLNIESFKDLPVEKAVEFMALVPQMQKDIAISAINQLPNYANLAGEIVKQVRNLSETAMEKNASSHKEALNSYVSLVNLYAEQIKSNKISRKERRELYYRMEEIADKAAAKDSENKKFIKDIAKKNISIINTILFLGGILGISLLGKRIK